MIANVEKVVDVKTIVVDGLCMICPSWASVSEGRKSVDFRGNSGLGFGFYSVQMVQWMLFPANWTLLFGGTW